MNRRITLACLLALTAVVSISAQDDDDLYFTPSRKKAKTEVQAPVYAQPGTVSVVPTEKPQVEVYNNNSRSDDEYNRRDKNQNVAWQTGGSAEDSVSYDSSDAISRYDLNDPELDFAYSRRLLRFHSPSIGIALSSPYYWDLVYGYGVYDYFYDPFYYDYYDPFFWNYGWGYGYAWGPWNSWYGPFWGWNHPYHWSYWGIGPTWHRTSLTPGGEHPSRINSGSSSFARRDRLTTGRVRTNALASNITSRNSSRSSLARTTPRTSITKDLQDRTGSSVNVRSVPRRESGTVRPSSTRTTVVRPNTERRTEQSVTRTEQPRTSAPARTSTQVRTSAPSRNVSSSPATAPSRSSSMSTPRSSGSFGGGVSGGSRGGGMGGGSRGGGRR